MSEQEHLNRLAGEFDSYKCENCEDYFDSDMMCDHDSNIHTLCVDCCDVVNESEYKEQFGKEDLD